MDIEPEIDRLTERVVTELLFSTDRHIRVLAAIVSFSIEPPEKFHVRQINCMSITPANSSESFAWKRVRILKELGMIQEVHQNSPNKIKHLIRVEHPEWSRIEGVVRASGIVLPCRVAAD